MGAVWWVVTSYARTLRFIVIKSRCLQHHCAAWVTADFVLSGGKRGAATHAASAPSAGAGDGGDDRDDGDAGGDE